MNVVEMYAALNNSMTVPSLSSPSYVKVKSEQQLTGRIYLSIVRLLREELGLLQQPGSYVGEVVKVMGSKRVLVKVHPEGKYGRLITSRLVHYCPN
jgi:ATP-dependent 26S proteasome regulatory subunit